jgi:hypothetical protein
MHRYNGISLWKLQGRKEVLQTEVQPIGTIAWELQVGPKEIVQEEVQHSGKTVWDVQVRPSLQNCKTADGHTVISRQNHGQIMEQNREHPETLSKGRGNNTK